MPTQNIVVPVTSAISNPASGVFGTGQVQFFTSSGSWTVPPGIGKVRARVWGAGGGYNNNGSYYSGGGGGGFAIKIIYGFDGVSSIPVIVGQGINLVSLTNAVSSAQSSSFGSYVSATGGGQGATGAGPSGGNGVGGDTNTSGGSGGYSASTASGGGGGCASIFGNGGNGGANANNGLSSSGGAGGGTGYNTYTAVSFGGNGFIGSGATYIASTVQYPATSGFLPFSIDLIGVGGGGNYLQLAFNGGGGSYGVTGAFPGGGNGYSGTQGGNGLVIVEW